MLPAMLLKGVDVAGPDMDELITWQTTHVGVQLGSSTTYQIGLPLYIDPTNSAAQDVSIEIDWGDGSKSTVTASDFPDKDNLAYNLAILHEVSGTNTYIIKATAKRRHWLQTYLFTSQNTIRYSSVPTSLHNLYIYREGWRSFDGPLPPFKGTAETNTSIGWGHCVLYENSLRYMNIYNKTITSLRGDLFQHCGHITDLSYAFTSNTALNSIDENVLNPLTELTNVNYTFKSCQSLMVPPGYLFAKNTKLNTMQSIFYGCIRMVTIPPVLFEGLNPTSVYACFESCSTVEYVPPSIIEHCTALTDIRNFLASTSISRFTLRLRAENIRSATKFVPASTSSLTDRVVYAPADSATYNTLQAQTSNLNFTLQPI